MKASTWITNVSIYHQLSLNQNQDKKIVIDQKVVELKMQSKFSPNLKKKKKNFKREYMHQKLYTL